MVFFFFSLKVLLIQYHERLRQFITPAAVVQYLTLILKLTGFRLWNEIFWKLQIVFSTPKYHILWLYICLLCWEHYCRCSERVMFMHAIVWVTVSNSWRPVLQLFGSFWLTLAVEIHEVSLLIILWRLKCLFHSAGPLFRSLGLILIISLWC